MTTSRKPANNHLPEHLSLLRFLMTDPSVTEANILQKSADAIHGVSVQQLTGRSTTSRVANTRHAIMYTLRHRFNCTLGGASLLVNRDHTTALYAINKIDPQLRTHRLDFSNLIAGSSIDDVTERHPLNTYIYGNSFEVGSVLAGLAKLRMHQYKWGVPNVLPGPIWMPEVGEIKIVPNGLGLYFHQSLLRNVVGVAEYASFLLHPRTITLEDAVSRLGDLRTTIRDPVLEEQIDLMRDAYQLS